MVRILFGDEFDQGKTVLLSLCNANSPMSWDYNMLGSAKVYAENNQACLITPFILSGAMAPASPWLGPRPDSGRSHGRHGVLSVGAAGGAGGVRVVRSSISMQSGRSYFGAREPALVLFVMAALARRLGVPFRSGGNLTAAKTPDYQAAFESAATFSPRSSPGVNFVLHTAGWLEGVGDGIREVRSRRIRPRWQRL